MQCTGLPMIYAQMGGRSARTSKFGVTVFKECMVNSWGLDLPVDLPSLV